MTAISRVMPADLAEAVRSLACGACQAPRGEYCPCDGTHLARWELAAAAALVSERDYRAATEAAQPAPAGFSLGLSVVPELSGVVCPVGHPLRWSAGVQPQQWVHLDQGATPSCPAPPVPGPARGTVPLPAPSLVTGRPGRGHRGHGAGLPAVHAQARPPVAQGPKSAPPETAPSVIPDCNF